MPSNVVSFSIAVSTAIRSASLVATQAGHDFWWLLWFGAGWLGFAIVALLLLSSVIALALILDNLLRLRRRNLVPLDLAEEVDGRLRRGDLSAVRRICAEDGSMLAAVLDSALDRMRQGPAAIDSAILSATQAEHARLQRKLDHLSIVSSVAPMLGLLGTVWGMVITFQKVAETQGRADPGQLAGGIYQALYTTVLGLMIAIPGLVCYGLLRNRIDQLAAEAADLAERLLSPLHRGRSVRKPADARATVAPTGAED